MTAGTGPLPYLTFGGIEVANAARVVEYIRNGLMQSAGGQIELGSGDLCGVLYRTGSGSTSGRFVSPASDPAPWYDASEAGATSFLGLIMLGIKGYDSTITRSVTPRLSGLGGGTFGAQHRNPRTWTFRAAMISSDDTGAEYGLRWLTSVLEQGCDGCSTSDLIVRLACPPANGLNDDLGKWTSYDATLVDGPREVEQFINQYGDGDSLAGCRDVVIVEWTMQAGNPFLYKPAVFLADATTTREGECVYVAPMEQVGEPITDLIRETGIEGDGLDAPSGYGLYPVSTNYHLNGSAEIPFSGSDWLTSSGTLTRTSALSMFGRFSALFAAPGSVANEGFTMRAVLAAADQFTSSTVRFSVWLRGALGGEQLTLTASIHHTDASTRTGTVTDITLTNEWARYTVSLAPTAAKTADQLNLLVATRTGATLAYEVYADGVQMEKLASSLPTPYIDTRGAIATRLAAAVLASGGPEVLDETVGWVALLVQPEWASTAGPLVGDMYVWDWRASSNQFLAVYYDTVAQAWKFNRRDFADFIVSVPDTFTAGEEVVVVATWDATHVYLSVNGSAFVSAAATVPALSNSLAVIGAHTNAALPPTYSDQLSGNIRWYGSSSAKTLTSADAAEIATLAPYGPSPSAFSFDIGLPGLETLTWRAETDDILTAIANGICDWLFGPPRQITCEAITPPARGTLGAVFTLTSEDGFGGVVFQAWPDCFAISGDPTLEMGISAVPAGTTVVVDSARHIVTITDEDGNESDGQYLIELSEGRGLEWIEVRDCDTTGCVCVAVQPCAVGVLNVTIDTQAREG